MSCLDSPDVGDVERQRKFAILAHIVRCLDSPDVGDVERIRRKLTQHQGAVASTLPMSPFEDKWEMLRLLEKLKGAED